MTVMSAGRRVRIKSNSGDRYREPVVGAATIYPGAIVLLSDGLAIEGQESTTAVAAGVSESFEARVAGERVRVREGEIGPFATGDSLTIANVGDMTYVVDDQTISTTATGRTPLGPITNVDSLGIWVHVSLEANARLMSGQALPV